MESYANFLFFRFYSHSFISFFVWYCTSIVESKSIVYHIFLMHFRLHSFWLYKYNFFDLIAKPKSNKTYDHFCMAYFNCGVWPLRVRISSTSSPSSASSSIHFLHRPSQIRKVVRVLSCFNLIRVAASFSEFAST